MESGEPLSKVCMLINGHLSIKTAPESVLALQELQDRIHEVPITIKTLIKSVFVSLDLHHIDNALRDKLYNHPAAVNAIVRDYIDDHSIDVRMRASD